MIFRLFSSSSFCSKRLVFFAEGGGPQESYRPEEGGEAGAGVSEAAAEQAAEDRKRGAVAAKHQRKQEKKVKKRENRLAEIMRFFIQGASQDDTMVVLLTRLLQRNTPVPILLSVLSLNYPDVIPLLEDYSEEEQKFVPEEPSHLHPASNTTLVEYGKELSEALSVWTKRIFTNASFHPMKAILALAHHHGVDHHIIQLTSLMIQRYFLSVGQEAEFDRIQSFSELFWQDALKKLHNLAAERGLLPKPQEEKVSDLFDDDEDDDED